MSTHPTTPKRFKNWLEKRALPPELEALGLHYWMALNVLALNKSNPDIGAILKREQKHIDAWTAAWAKHQSVA